MGGHQPRPRLLGRSVTRSRSSASLSSVSAASPATSTESASDALAAEQLGDPLLDGAGGDHPVHLDRPGLPDPVGPVAGLVLDGGVPPAVEVDDVVGAGEVEAGAAGLEGQQEDGHLAGLEARAPSARARAPASRRGAAGGRTPCRVRWPSSSRAIATYWVKTSTAPSSATTVPTISSSRSIFSEDWPQRSPA